MLNMSLVNCIRNQRLINTLCFHLNIKHTGILLRDRVFYSRKLIHLYSNPTFTLQICRNKLNVGTINSITHVPQRTFAKRHKREHSDSESSDEEDNDVVDKYDKGVKIIRSRMTSLRLDAVLKIALGLARNKIEVAFYESKIRLNGEKVLKKSQRVNVGDEIDLVKGLSPMNPNFINVSRVEIISVKADENGDEILVKMKRNKSLQVENYERTPYKERENN